MARDPSALPSVSREAILNYAPAMGQALVDNCIVAVHLKIAIDKTMADAAVLYTIPTGKALSIVRAYWEVSVSWSGGASSAIGISSANAAYSTKGDILGGAAGDVAAMLVSTGSPYKGTLGPKMLMSAGTTSSVVLVATDIIRYDKVTSTFTAGSGFVHIDGFLVD